MSFGSACVNAEFEIPEESQESPSISSELIQEEREQEEYTKEEPKQEEPTEENTVSEIPLVEPNPNVEDIQGLMKEPLIADNQDMILTELIQIRLCLQILVFGVFPLCVAVIGLTKLIAWMSRRFT